MMRWPLLALGGAALIGLAACDSRDYEAEITELESQLQDAETRLQESLAANEDLNAQMAELEGGQVSETVQTELNEAYSTAQQTYERLGALEREPGADPQLIEEAVVVLREDIQAMMDSLQSAGQELGVQLEQGAGGTGQGAGGGAGQAGQAAGQGAGQAGGAEQTGEEPQQQNQ